MLSIGLDIGTTTISVVVYDSDKDQVIASKTVSNDSFIKSENNWERIQETKIIILNAKSALDELLQQYTNVQYIGITGQMHGIVYTNANGGAVSPLYTWQDARGDLQVENGKCSFVEWLKETTGEKVASGYGLVTHFWNLKNNNVPNDAAQICTIGDYLGMQLCGLKSPIIHISNAASLGFFDLENKSFKCEKLQKLGMDCSILPTITAEFKEIGKYKGIPVVCGIGDNQASFIGAVGLQDGCVLLNMGTGGQISVLSERVVDTENIETRPITKNKYLLVGASLCGGRALAIVENFFKEYVKIATGKEDSQYDVLAKLAGRYKKFNDELKVSTCFMGTRANPNLRGSINGISENNFTPEAFAYGVFEGMADELFSMYQEINTVKSVNIQKLIASGNALRLNKILCEIFSEKFDAPIELSKCKEEAATGAAKIKFQGGI